VRLARQRLEIGRASLKLAEDQFHETTEIGEHTSELQSQR
jgi:hypothetical protein